MVLSTRLRILLTVFGIAFAFGNLPQSFGQTLTIPGRGNIPYCSLSKTNGVCALVIDRENPIAPSTVQMFSGQTVFVLVKHPLPFERYFLDVSTGQAALTPDVTSTIAQTTFAALGKLTLFTTTTPAASHAMAVMTEDQKDEQKLKACNDDHFKGTNWPRPGEVRQNKAIFYNCFGQLANFALETYRRFEPITSPDSLTGAGGLPPEPYFYISQEPSFLIAINEYVKYETLISNEISVLSKAPSVYNPPAQPTDPKAPKPATPYSADDVNLIEELVIYQKLIDSVSADLLGYEARIRDIGPCRYTDEGAAPDQSCVWEKDVTKTYKAGSLVIEGPYPFLLKSDYTGDAEPFHDSTHFQLADPADIKYLGVYDPAHTYRSGNVVRVNDSYRVCVSDCYSGSTSQQWLPEPSLPDVIIESRKDDAHIYQNMVTRTVTYSLDDLNLFSYSQEAAPGAANKKAIASIALNFADHPNKRLGSPYTALRWDGSAGVFFSSLPNRTFTLTSASAVQDSKARPTPVPFAAANYRLTGDFGTRWKQNIYATAAVGINPINTTAEFGVGPSYAWRAFMVSALCHFGHDTRWTTMTPGSNGNLPTTSHWTEKFAIGISVRVPSLTGR